LIIVFVGGDGLFVALTLVSIRRRIAVGRIVTTSGRPTLLSAILAVTFHAHNFFYLLRPKFSSETNNKEYKIP
jgi:hypothetical protein